MAQGQVHQFGLRSLPLVLPPTQGKMLPPHLPRAVAK